jgi:glycosyltransferase involved in cell wall biosynthesis
MKIEFVIPTYSRTHHLMTLLNSLCAQSSNKWIAHVVADCPPEGTLDRIIEFFKDEPRIKFTILQERYNDWGHTPRNYGVQQASEEWVVMTGEDNYYVPTFVEEFLKHANHNTHFVFCDMVHNWVNQDYIYVPCAPVYGRIDIGNFMTKTKNAKQLKLNVSLAAADAVFVDEYLKKFIGVVRHISKILYVHN